MLITTWSSLAKTPELSPHVLSSPDNINYFSSITRLIPSHYQPLPIPLPHPASHHDPFIDLQNYPHLPTHTKLFIHQSTPILSYPIPSNPLPPHLNILLPILIPLPHIHRFPTLLSSRSLPAHLLSFLMRFTILFIHRSSLSEIFPGLLLDLLRGFDRVRLRG